MCACVCVRMCVLMSAGQHRLRLLRGWQDARRVGLGGMMKLDGIVCGARVLMVCGPLGGTITRTVPQPDMVSLPGGSSGSVARRGSLVARVTCDGRSRFRSNSSRVAADCMQARAPCTLASGWLQAGSAIWAQARSFGCSCWCWCREAHGGASHAAMLLLGFNAWEHAAVLRHDKRSIRAYLLLHLCTHINSA